MAGTFYLVSTPYHVLLALADAEREARPAALYFYGAFPSAALYLQALRDAPALLPGLVVEGLAGSAKSGTTRRAARAGLRSCLVRAQPDRVVVFNDRHDLSQFALALAARRADTRRVCLEDGSSFYTRWLAPATGFWTQLRKRGFTAKGWTAIRVPGTHPLVQEVRVLRPDAVRPELQARALRLDVNLLSSPVLKRFGERLLRLLRAAGLIGDLPACPEVLLTPPLENVADWAARVQEFLRASSGLAVKHHPRQAQANPGDLLRHGSEIARQLPLELLYLLWGRAPRCVIGDGNSTTLLSTRLFDADSRVVGLCTRGRPEHGAAYEKLGIELHSDAPPESAPSSPGARA